MEQLPSTTEKTQNLTTNIPGGEKPFLYSLQNLRKLPAAFGGFFQFVSQEAEDNLIGKLDQIKLTFKQSIPQLRRQILFLLDFNPSENDPENHH